MEKVIIKFFLFIVYLNGSLTHKNLIYNELKLRVLKPTALLNSLTKNIEFLKLHSKILQTVYSDSYSKNYYYTTLYIGTNHIKQTYIIDTGSSIMSSPCKPCTGCGAHKKNYFYISKTKKNSLKCDDKICKMVSATNCIYNEDKENNKNSCSFYIKQNNGDGLRGYYLNDIVYFQTDNNISFSPLKEKQYRSYALPIGCTVEEYGNYKELYSDGIMGINNNEKSFINLLYKLKIINRNVFSLCFSLSGGYMSLGEVDKTYHREKKINYVPLLNSNIFYLIKVKSITIGDDKKAINIKRVARIDTGNTLSYFPLSIYKSLITEFNKYCKNEKCGVFQFDKDLGYCATFKDRESLFKSIYKYWPNITLHLEKNTEYIWKPINYYYYNLKSTSRKACLGFNSHKSQNIILGTNFIHGHDIIFDRANKKLGFVLADCSRGNMLFKRIKGNNKTNIHISEKNPALFDKIIHKNEKKGKFYLGDNIENDLVEFIQGHNTELDFSKDFKLINLIILMSSVVIVLIVIVIIVSNLVWDNKKKLKNKYLENIEDSEVEDERGDNKIIFDDNINTYKNK